MGRFLFLYVTLSSLDLVEIRMQVWQIYAFDQDWELEFLTTFFFFFFDR